MTQAKEQKSFPAFGVKLLDAEQGIVEHIVAVMGNIDRGNDVIHPGAFVKSLMERGGKVKVLDGHDASSVLNVVGKPLEIREVGRLELPPDLIAQYPDATGALVAKTQFLLDTPEGRGVFDRIKNGAVDEYSIGYDPIVADYATLDRPEGKTTVRNLREVRLWEYSPVVFAMNPATSTLSAKDAKPGDEAKVKPGADESEDDFMGRCIPAMVEEGREQEQAVAMCASMFAQATEGEDEEKRKRRRRKIPAAGTGAVHAVVLDSDDGKVTEKQASLEEQIRRVRDAWYARFEPARNDGAMVQSANRWPRDVYTDKIIVEQEDGLWAYPYTAQNGEIVFGDPIKVELTYKPAKSLKAGRRVRKEKLEEARAAMATLADFLKWADYDESETPDEGDDEKKPKAAAGPDLHPRQKQAMIERLKLELTEV